jgi:two-component system LytT family sensor kinase
MVLTRLSKGEKIRHLLIWLFILAYLQISSPITIHWFYQLIGCIFSVLNFAILYYSLLCFVFPNALNGRKWLLLPCFIWLFILYFCIKWYNGTFLIHFARIYSPPGRFLRYLSTAAFFFIPISIMAYSAYASKLALEKFKREKERGRKLMHEELDFLKSQFNFHLTFNLLSFLYSQVLKSSEQAAEAIAFFSEMLHYSIRVKPEEQTTLQEEMENVLNFVELERRLKIKSYFEITWSGDIRRKKIFPHILLSFVERALRYGISGDPENPIKINLLATESEIIFEVESKIDFAKNAQFPDIDENLKCVFDMFYENEYLLDADQKDGICREKLVISCK